MKREICCVSCADSWRKIGERYPEETVQIVRGKALRPLKCDGCNADLNKGDPACAVSVLATGHAYDDARMGKRVPGMSRNP